MAAMTAIARSRRSVGLAFVGLVAGATLVTSLAPSAADARRTVIVRDGTYGWIDTGGGQSFRARVRNRRVSKISFMLNMSCRNVDTGETYDRAFDAGRNAPQGRRVPRQGLYEVTWTEESSGYRGEITVMLDFDRSRPEATVGVSVPQVYPGLEECNVAAFLPLRRGRLIPTT